MSDERVICTYLGGIKRDQIHQLKRLFVWDGTKFVPQPEVFFSDPTIAKDVGDMIGYLNQQETEQYPVTPVATIFDVAWGDGTRFLTKDIVPFGCNIIAMRFTVPATPTSYNKPGYTSIAENEGPPTLRQGSISKVAGDFSASALTISNPGTQVTLDWSVGTPGILSLTPGVWFINFRNWDGTKCSCPTPSCNAGFSTNWPQNI